MLTWLPTRSFQRMFRTRPILCPENKTRTTMQRAIGLAEMMPIEPKILFLGGVCPAPAFCSASASVIERSPDGQTSKFVTWPSMLTPP